MAKIKSRRSNLFVNIVLVAAIIYLLFVFINIQVKISDKKSKDRELDTQISLKLDEQEQLQSTLDAPMDEEYAEKVAREHGYVSSDEKVYESVS